MTAKPNDAAPHHENRDSAAEPARQEPAASSNKTGDGQTGSGGRPAAPKSAETSGGAGKQDGSDAQHKPAGTGARPGAGAGRPQGQAAGAGSKGVASGGPGPKPNQPAGQPSKPGQSGGAAKKAGQQGGPARPGDGAKGGQGPGPQKKGGPQGAQTQPGAVAKDARPANKPQGDGVPAGQARAPGQPPNAGATGQDAAAKNLPARSNPPNVPATTKQTPPAPAPETHHMGAAPDKGVPRSGLRGRHIFLLVSFLVLVVIPSALAFGYLYTRAHDRFASTAAFSVHKEDGASSMEMFGGLTALGVSGGTTPDADILYQFIQSQRIVEAVDAQVDLRSVFGRYYEQDPVFGLDPNASLEDMVDYWDRVVSLVLEPDVGMITLEVTAFSPGEAQEIAKIMLDESSDLVNRLSKIAREDSIQQAQRDLDIAGARLKDTRLAMSKFRDIEQIVDPSADFAGQMGVITALQQSLAEAMVRRDLLIGTTRDGDPRIQQAEREIAAIRNRIADERTKIGTRKAEDGDALSKIVGEYESLLVDREFAEQSYLAALAAYDATVADARRKSRYLAVHIEPSLAETAIYPRRVMLGSLITGFLTVFWALFALTIYSIRDRR